MGRVRVILCDRHRIENSILEEALQMRDVLLLRLLLGLRDIHECQQRELLRPDGVTVMRRALAQLLVQFPGARLRHEHRRIAEAEFGRDLEWVSIDPLVPLGPEPALMGRMAPDGDVAAFEAKASELSGHQVPDNKPVMGERLFEIESGIINNWLSDVGRDCTTELFPVLPERVGQKAGTSVLGKGSGLDSVKLWPKEKGFDITDEGKLNEILTKIKAKSLDKKGLLDEGEFRQIVESVK